MAGKKEKHDGGIDDRTPLIFEFLDFVQDQGKRIDLCSTVVRLELISKYLEKVDAEKAKD